MDQQISVRGISVYDRRQYSHDVFFKIIVIIARQILLSAALGRIKGFNMPGGGRISLRLCGGYHRSVLADEPHRSLQLYLHT